MVSRKVAFLVVCWNNKDIISNCIKSIMDQSYDEKDIYVIDNDSKDGSSEFISKKFPTIKLIASDKNNGFAKGNNILIKEAIKDRDVGYLALINSDAVIDKNWTSEIINYISSKKKVSGAQGLTLDYYDRRIIDAEHTYIGSNFQSVQYGYGETKKEAFAYPRKVFGVNAAAALYTRDYIEDQKNKVLFDEKFYMYLEDVDISFRAIITGWNNFYIPSAKAYHMGSISSKKRKGSYNIYMTFRNQPALLFKNMPFSVFSRNLIESLKFERHFYKHLKKTQGKEVSRLALKGRVIGILRIPIYIPDRIRILRKRRISNSELNDVMSNKGIF